MSKRSPKAIRAAVRCWRSALACCSALLLLGMAAGAVALPEDRKQPIHISADQAIRDDKQGYTVYQGKVQMSQGSLKITAGKVTVYHQVEEADRIVAEGSPAHLQQRPGPDKRLVHARANIIEYYKAEERVMLRRNASLEQDGSRVAGESIEYFIAKQLIKADSDSASEAGSENTKRVQVVIPASTLEQEDDSGSADRQ